MSQDQSPLLPERDTREAALFFVVCVLCFLAAMAALTARSTYAAARGWTADVEGQMTVRLLGEDRRSAAEARDLIAALPGIEAAEVLSSAAVEELLAPSFGANGLPAGLPLPLIIAVEAHPEDGPSPDDITARLEGVGLTVAVDSHDTWAGDVRRALGTIRLLAISTVAVLVATAVAVIAFATHAALLARRDIVEVLHLSGANDRFISELFERRFWVLALRAGALGALFALATVALALSVATVPGARSGLLPQLSLDATDLLILIATPIIAALAARFAARTTVMRALKDTL